MAVTKGINELIDQLAAYNGELAKLERPERFEARKRQGVIDVVLTNRTPVEVGIDAHQFMQSARAAAKS